MSHFTVTVCLPKDTELRDLDDRLGEILARWDENREVDEWRDYEDGTAEEYWWVRSVRRGAKHHHGGTIDEHDRRSVVFGHPEKTNEQVRAEYAEDASWSDKLGEQADWETVVRLYNEKYHPGNELALTDDPSDSDRLHYDPETGRAYTLTTRNPEAKWDYWRIGGRWGGYFIAAENGPGLITGTRGWDSPKDAPDDGRLRCDGGPRGLLDFEAMRDEAEKGADERYSKWEAICADTPPAKPWEYFTGLIDLKEMSIDEARQAYHAQPRIQRATKRGEELVGWDDCPVEHFMADRAEYLARARRAAVPNYALVTLDGEWVAPGRMGWFGMSSDGPGEREGYHYAANRYLDELDPSTFVVVVDCHI